VQRPRSVEISGLDVEAILQQELGRAFAMSRVVILRGIFKRGYLML
jgi:hypothetical protein